MYTDFYFDLERVEEKSKIAIIKPITLVHLTQERSLSDPLLRFPESLPFGFIVLVPLSSSGKWRGPPLRRSTWKTWSNEAFHSVRSTSSTVNLVPFTTKGRKRTRGSRGKPWLPVPFLFPPSLCRQFAGHRSFCSSNSMIFEARRLTAEETSRQTILDKDDASSFRLEWKIGTWYWLRWFVQRLEREISLSFWGKRKKKKEENQMSRARSKRRILFRIISNDSRNNYPKEWRTIINRIIRPNYRITVAGRNAI